MKTGISSYTYSWAIGVPGKEPKNPMNVYQLIEKAVEFDVPVVQIADNLPLDKFNRHELINIKDFAEKHQINLELGARKMIPHHLEKYIGLAAFLHSPILRFVIDGTDYEPELEEVVAIIKNAIPSLEKNNVILAIENHDRFKAEEFVEIVKKSQSKFVGICLDSVNSMGAGEGLETVISKLAPYTVNLHVKEFYIRRVYHQMGFVIEGCPLGKGMLPLKDLINRISPNCGSAILEQWTPPDDTIEKTIKKESAWAEESINYLKNTIL